MATALHANERGTVLRTGGPAGPTVVALAAEPDRDGARRRLRSVRRIDSVDFVVGSSGTRAEVRGKRNRLPFTGPVSIAVALGLAELGVRARVVNGGR